MSWLHIITGLFLQFVVLALPVAGQTIVSMLEQHQREEAVDIETLLRTYFPEPIKLNELKPDRVAELWFLTVDQSRQLKNILRSKNRAKLDYQFLSNLLNLPIEQVKIIFKLPGHARKSISHRIRMKNNARGTSQEQKLNFIRDNLTFNATVEQDAGEKDFDDFKSGSLKFTIPEFNSTVVLGDFTLQNATGLLFAGAFSPPRLASTHTAVYFSQPKLRPYRSISENFALRGGAMHFQNRKFQWLTFISQARRDANIDSNGFATSKPQSGLHITESERQHQNRLREVTTGMMIQWTFSANLLFGASISRTVYNHQFRPANLSRQRFNFAGKRKQTGSLNTAIRLPSGNMRIVGEIAGNQKNEYAALLGMTKMDKNHGIALLVWQSTPGYDVDYGVLPGKQIGKTSNTAGFYLGTFFRGRSGKFNLSFRRESTPWRTYTIPQPDEKQVLTFYFKNRFRKILDLKLQAKLTIKPEKEEILPNVAQINGIIIEKSTTGNYYLKTAWRLAKNVTYNFRLDFSQCKRWRNKYDHGWVQTHQMKMRLASGNRLRIGFSNFTIDDYSSRIYLLDYRFADLFQPVLLNGNGHWMTFSFECKLKYCKLAGYIIREKKQDLALNNQWGIQLSLVNRNFR